MGGLLPFCATRIPVAELVLVLGTSPQSSRLLNTLSSCIASTRAPGMHHFASRRIAKNRPAKSLKDWIRELKRESNSYERALKRRREAQVTKPRKPLRA